MSLTATLATYLLGNREIATPADDWFFFHLPKTAGGTLVAGIRDNSSVYWPTDPNYPKPSEITRSRKRTRWLGGHTALGLHQLYGSRPQYITVLRDPIERLISEYFYQHAHNMPDRYIPAAERLPSFLHYISTRPHLNYYCYMFSAYCYEKQAALEGISWSGTPEHAHMLI